MEFKIDSISDPKPHRKWNEDLIDSYQNVYWLLDGASIPCHLARVGHMNTRWYVQQLSEGLKQALAQRASSPLQKILSHAIGTVQTKMQAQNTTAESDAIMPSSTVVLIRLNGPQIEYLLLGDSYLLIHENAYTKCITDQRIKTIAPDTRQQIKQVLAHGEGFHSNQLRRLKHQLVFSEMQSRNQKEGYWIASDNKEAAYHALTGCIQLSPNQTISLLLMSDGFARAVTHLNLFSSWQEFIHLIHNRGLNHCLQLVREQERADAMGQRYIRSSQHDDASALFIRLSYP
jgi:serine/threonine protein phosphatase PrpC